MKSNTYIKEYKPEQVKTPVARESVLGIGIAQAGYFPSRKVEHDSSTQTARLLFPFSYSSYPDWWRKLLIRKKELKPTY